MKAALYAAFFVVVAAGGLFSQAEAGPARQALPEWKIAEPAPRSGITGARDLTLAEAIELALANDPDIQISRIAMEEAGFREKGALGSFDPVFTLDTYKSRTVTPIATLIGGAESGKLTSKELTLNPSISGISRALGGSYNLSFSHSKQLSDSTFNTLNPQYPSHVSLTYTQPLWRGLRIDQARYQLQVARKNRSLTAEDVRQRVTERITLITQSYWELSYAYQNLLVQTEAVRLAAEQYESNRRQAEQGLLAPISVVEAQTQIAIFEQSQAIARQNLTAAENNLKQALAESRSDPLWGESLKPVTPIDTHAVGEDLDEALRLAFASRPELSASSLKLAINGLAMRYNRDQTKPRVDAYTTLTVAGLAGTQQPVPPIFGDFGGGMTLPPILLGASGQSLSNIWNGNFPGVRVGLRVSMPFGNRTAEASAALSQAEDRRLQALKKQTESAVEADVRNAVEQVNSARSRYSAATVARQSAEEQYASEKRQFEAGTSTVFLVFQRQSSFISARSSETRARVDLGQAFANLNRATSQTLEKYDIKLDK
ncbi:MAG: TolC family protein [Bryobacterales bacterium]|nr:TolC family protein [Bryobacterales bacterium]